MDIFELTLFLICLALTALLIVSALAIVTTAHYPKIRVYPGEESFLNPADGTRLDFPDIRDAPTLDLTVVIPAYNERERLPVMLEDAFKHLEGQKGLAYEVILVDDGSKDDTSKVGLKWAEKLGCDRFRVLTLAQNRGKGGAVRMGMLRGRGKRLLFADADGATKFADVEKLGKVMDKLGEWPF